MYILFTVLGILAVFILVVIIRTFAFVPRENSAHDYEEVTFDKDAAVSALGELVKCKTVSRYSHDQEDEAEFEKLISLLPTLYPNVWKKCKLIKFEDRGLLFRWEGKEVGEPTVLMAHYDVVPVDEAKWEKPPFSAISS